VAIVIAFPLFAIGFHSVWIGGLLAIALIGFLAAISWGLGRSRLISARSAFGWLLVCQVIACVLIWMWAASQIE
jgi:predicted lipid-binding transport protein (Tim44 family)